VLLRFPDGRLAAFSSSFGAADVASYRVVGTKGDVRLDQAYEYVYPIELYVTVKGKTRKQTFANEISLRPSWSTSPVVFLTTRLQNPRGPKELRMCALSKRCMVRQNADERSKSNRCGKRKGLRSNKQNIDRPSTNLRLCTPRAGRYKASHSKARA
jgi:hypothetical protein